MMRRLSLYLSVLHIVCGMWIEGGGTTIGQVPVATISGSVTDTAGAVIAGADLIVKLKGTGVERRVRTQADGNYQVENLQPGTYEVEACTDGFRTVWRLLTLQVGDHIKIDFELQPGLSSQKVEVRGEVTGVNTTDFKVDGSVSGIQIENLPLNGRSFIELAQLEPGVNVESVSNPGCLGTIISACWSPGHCLRKRASPWRAQ